jgi:putative restriction endonuclease
MPIWAEAVTNAIRRHVARTGSPLFTRRALIAAEGKAIEAETLTRGRTPTQTLGRELQQLRDAGMLAFLERGTYRWLGDMPESETAPPSKGVFVLTSAASGQPELAFRFPEQWSRTAQRLVGNWVIYQEGGEGGGYRAAARVERVERERTSVDMWIARPVQGSYLEFGREVPLAEAGEIIERGLIDASGRLSAERAAQRVRAISDGEFDRIIDLGLIGEDEVLPRTDDEEAEEPVLGQLREEQSAWVGPVDRATMLVNRTVRDRQFRKRVLEAHLGRYCAEFDLRYNTRDMTDGERAAVILKGGVGRRPTYRRVDKFAA